MASLFSFTLDIVTLFDILPTEMYACMYVYIYTHIHRVYIYIYVIFTCLNNILFKKENLHLF